jgi:hypothetical protein
MFITNPPVALDPGVCAKPACSFLLIAVNGRGRDILARERLSNLGANNGSKVLPPSAKWGRGYRNLVFASMLFATAGARNSKPNKKYDVTLKICARPV